MKNHLFKTLCLITIGFSTVTAQENPVSPEKPSEANKATLDSVSKVILATYKAMEEKNSKVVLASHHPKTNLDYTKEGLEAYFAQMDVTYSITNIRYIGNDKKNFVVIYREKMQLRKKGEKKIFDEEDTDVVMVLRKDKGQFKIYTFNSLKPGLW